MQRSVPHQSTHGDIAPGRQTDLGRMIRYLLWLLVPGRNPEGTAARRHPPCSPKQEAKGHFVQWYHHNSLEAVLLSSQDVRSTERVDDAQVGSANGKHLFREQVF